MKYISKDQIVLFTYFILVGALILSLFTNSTIISVILGILKLLFIIYTKFEDLM